MSTTNGKFKLEKQSLRRSTGADRNVTGIPDITLDVTSVIEQGAKRRGLLRASALPKKIAKLAGILKVMSGLSAGVTCNSIDHGSLL